MLNLNNKKIKTPSLRRTLMIACRSTHMVPVFFFHKRQKMVHGSTFCYFNVNREIYLVTALKPNTCTIDLSFNFNGFVKLIFLTNKFTEKNFIFYTKLRFKLGQTKHQVNNLKNLNKDIIYKDISQFRSELSS